MQKPALLLISLSLLASCSQHLSSGEDPVSATPQVSYEARKSIAANAQAKPAEPLAPGAITNLATTFPGGKTLNAQSVDKSVPIVLVHGMTGFGRDEMLGLHYWGGLYDVQEDLKALGYQVFTVSIGPVSSNWDRAAEIFAQLRGGCVDYGAAHSANAGHTRSDARKCYTALYPQWDAAHPINLIGHSMGAPTSRMLVKLLEDGSPADAANNNLFVGQRRGWVKNVMSISGANTGTPAADNIEHFLPFIKDTLITIGIAAGTNPIYNFSLGQFGIYQQPGETYKHYVQRVLSPDAPLWKTNDQAAHDLKPDTAYRENQFVGRSTFTKYFSWATAATSRGFITGWHYPHADMLAPLVAIAYPYTKPLSNGLGNMTGSSPEQLVQYDSSWWENDGEVPVKVQHEPLGQTAVDYTGQATQPGHWYRLGKIEGYDHIDITGNLTLHDVKQFYRNQAAFLSSQN